MREDLPTKIKTNKTIFATWKVFPGRFLVLALWGLVLACDQRKEIIDAPQYEGPLSSMDSAITLMSDSGYVKMTMKAAEQDNFENGDQEWPAGFDIVWYDKTGAITGSFSANYVYYTKSENLYRAEGNVVVKSNENQDELNTEELFWDQVEKKFYTEKFVTIKSDDEVHTGEGMESNEQFTEYRILKPSGTFTLEDDPNRPAERDMPLRPARKEQ